MFVPRDWGSSLEGLDTNGKGGARNHSSLSIDKLYKCAKMGKELSYTVMSSFARADRLSVDE
jgi:hypothetical protein